MNRSVDFGRAEASSAAQKSMMTQEDVVALPIICVGDVTVIQRESRTTQSPSWSYSDG
jgi:hypothetical protein